jgi:hypothetical protein
MSGHVYGGLGRLSHAMAALSYSLGSRAVHVSATAACINLRTASDDSTRAFHATSLSGNRFLLTSPSDFLDLTLWTGSIINVNDFSMGNLAALWNFLQIFRLRLTRRRNQDAKESGHHQQVSELVHSRSPLHDSGPIRDRKKPHGPSLPHHRTNGSRIRRFGRLS